MFSENNCYAKRLLAAQLSGKQSYLKSDQKGKMVDSKDLTHIALDGITILGQAQASLSIARKQKM